MLKHLRRLFGRQSAAAPSTAPANTQTSSTEASWAVPAGAPRTIEHPIPRRRIDADAAKIVGRLTRHGHTAFLVGGCVRDLLLDRRPKDFDIATDATPRQVKRLFRNCRIIGRRFRLAHIYFHDGKIIEVATFRAQNQEGDDESSDDLLIRDDNIFGSPAEDALRRDFTINQLFYNVEDQTVLDHAGGLEDLEQRLIRTIGNADVRLREDPIRSLRAIKFAGRLDFTIEPETLHCLKETRNLIPKAAAPRILEEINRFCRGGAARRTFELCRETGVFEVILPELAEGYEDHSHAWPMLFDLLDAIDARHDRDEDTSTGEIFAVLLLPLLCSRMGWHRDGRVERPRELMLRELVDERLRPIAVRLRIPRREQEHCRQILTTLHRMVPVQGIRRAARESILRRPCTSACLWILAAIADRRGGEFERALTYWKERVARRADRPKQAAGERSQTRSRPGDGERRRRRRRRGGRRKAAAGQKPAADQKPTAGQKAAAGRKAVSRSTVPSGRDQSDMPSPWDDNYFFAALPSVPAEEEQSRDDDDGPAEPGAARPKRRRRRRRRRRPESAAGSDPVSADRDAGDA